MTIITWDNVDSQIPNNNFNTLLPDPNLKTENDIFTAEFFDSQGNVGSTITNFTSFNLERDFFTPADAFVMVIEDDRVREITKALTNGTGCLFSINQVPLFYGYIFDYHLEYSRTEQRVTIQGQDLLGWMNKATCMPNLGSNTDTNFHFKPTDSIQFALQTIFNAFTAIANLPQTITVEIGNGLADTFSNTNPSVVIPGPTFQTGFLSGLKVNAKSPRGLGKGLETALEHLSRPQKGETYLGYAVRIAKHVGANIKMKQGSNQVIIVDCPKYNNNSDFEFSIFNSSKGQSAAGQTAGGFVFETEKNNILSGSIKINVADQPSVIFAEIGNSGNNAFFKSAYKAVIINEITGYDRVQGGYLNIPGLTPIGGAKTNITYPILPISNAVSQITNIADQGAQSYDFIPPNQPLYDILPQTVMQIQTGVSLPRYFVDTEAHTNSETRFGAAKAMAESQDKYFTLNYTVDKFSQGEVQNIWYPNLMVNVYDDALDDTNPINGQFWLRKVNWTKSKDDDIHCHLELTLPFTHAFDISQTQVKQNTINNGLTEHPDFLHNNYKETNVPSKVGPNHHWWQLINEINNK